MYVLVIFMITIILMLIAFFRYRYLLKYSDNPFIHVYVFIIATILFSGVGWIPIVETIMNKETVDTLLLGILFQIPLIVSTVIFNILKIKYRKLEVLISKKAQNRVWK